jgi:sugar phosphate isomerase/epimerase
MKVANGRILGDAIGRARCYERGPFPPGATMAKINVALQLYTVREQLKNDFAGTIRQVAKIGYRAIEAGAAGDLNKAKADRKVYDDAGLKVSGCMPGIDLLEKDLAKVLDEAEILGTKNVIVPWMPEERRKDTAGWKACAATMEKLGAGCQKRGFEFAYHNHSFEFAKFDGKMGMDIFYENCDPKLVRAEVDIYWVKHGGVDVVPYLHQLGKRILIVHLKDMLAGPEQRFAAVGTGTIDFAGVLAAAEKYEVKWGVVEQDQCYDVPPIEAAKFSLEYLRKLGAE